MNAKEIKLITLGLCSFSFTQILGILYKGYGYHQSIFLIFLLFFLYLIPGFLRYGMLQREHSGQLQSHHIFSCFIPSLIGIGIMLIGFLLGLYIGD